MRLLLASLLLVAAVGCQSLPGSGGGERPAGRSVTNPNFPEVTDRLREACWAFSDAEIAALIVATEQDAANGRTRGTQIEDAIVFCPRWLTGYNHCMSCMMAVVDHVYP